jgi:hypothetical protein
MYDPLRPRADEEDNLPDLNPDFPDQDIRTRAQQSLERNQQEVQAIEQSGQWTDGMDPKAIKMAKSRDPREARQGQREMQRRQVWNERAQQKIADTAQQEQQLRAREQQAAADQARAEQVRVAREQGIKIKTDTKTGRETIARHPDGEPIRKAGLIKDAPLIPSQTRTVIKETKDDPGRMVPNTDIMLGGGESGLDIGQSGVPSGATTSTSLLQQFQNDRGEVDVAEPDATTDPKTGRRYIEAKDAYGRPAKKVVGIDPNAQRKLQLEQESAQLDLHSNALETSRIQNEPRWSAVEKSWNEAQAEWNKPAPYVQTPTGWATNDDKRNAVDPAIAEQWKKSRTGVEARYQTAKRRYESEIPAKQNLEEQKRQIALKKIQIDSARTRLEHNLPEEDGGVAEGIAREQTGQVSPEQQAITDAVGSTPGAENAPTEEKPLVPQDDEGKRQLFLSAFQGLKDPETYTLGASGKGYTFLQRNGANIGSLDVDKNGNAAIVLNRNTIDGADLLNTIAVGTVKGTSIYLAEGAGTRDQSKENQWIASIYQTRRDDPAMEDATYATSKLKELGADPSTIMRRVNAGDLSLQRGEALMRDLYGATLKAEDPTAPGTFEKWLSSAPKDVSNAWAVAKGQRDTAAQNEIKKQYLNEWFVASRSLPGITMGMRREAEKSITGELRTGEKAAAVGQALVQAGGSMLGMLSSPAAWLKLQGQALLTDDNDITVAANEQRRNLTEASKNTWRNWDKNVQQWTTPEGKARKAAFGTAAQDLQAWIESQDSLPGGMENPDWKAGYKARIDAVTDAALQLHELNQQDGWEITRADLDPSQNQNLAKLVNGYALTGDRSLLDQYLNSLTVDHGSREYQTMIAELTEGRSPFMAGVIAGAYAPPEEILVEAASAAATGVLSSAVFGGAKAAKAAQVVAKGAEAAGTASRINRFRRYALGIAKEAKALGMVEDTLAKPASALGKAQNFAAKAAKVAVPSALGEGAEEAVMAAADPNATQQSIAQDAAMGAVMGLFMTPVIGVPTMIAENSAQAFKRAEAVGKFAAQYNRMMADTPGFRALTAKDAEAAMALVSPGRKQVLIENANAAAANLQQAAEAANQPDATGEAHNNLARAQAASLRAQNEIVLGVIEPVEAVASLQSLDPAQRDFGRGILKVASGRADLLTPAETTAIQARKTQDGSPYFENRNGIETVTPAGRADLLANMNAIGRLVQTNASQEIANQALEGSAPQGAVPTDSAVIDGPNYQRAPITPEVRQQAADVVTQVMQAVTAQYPQIASRVQTMAPWVDRITGGVGARIGPNGEPAIEIIPDDIAHQIAIGTTPEQMVKATIDNIVLHETIHNIGGEIAHRALPDDPHAAKTFYGALYQDIAKESPQVFANARDLYGHQNWDTLTNDWQRAAEYIRILAEAKIAGRTTDVYRLTADTPASIREKLAKIVEQIVAIITTGKGIPDSVKQHVDQIAELYNELLNAPTAETTSPADPGNNPAQPPNSSQNAGDNQQAQEGSDPVAANNVRPESAPSDPSGAPAQPAAAVSPELTSASRVTAQVFTRIIGQRPILRQDKALIAELDDVAFDLADQIVGMPEAEQVAAVENTLNAHLMSPEVSARRAELEKAKADKERAYRDIVMRRIRAEADRVIGSRMKTILKILTDAGRIQRPPNILPFLARQDTLSDDYQATKKRLEDYAAWPKVSDYPGGGKNAVIRAIIQAYMAPDSDTGVRLDDVDKAFGVPQDEVAQLVRKELDAYARGADGDIFDDPDAELTDAQIEEGLKRNERDLLRDKWRQATGKREVLTPQAKAYEEAYQRIVAAEGENEFLDDDYMARAIAEVDGPKAPKTPQATAEPAAPSIEDDGSVFAAVELGNEVNTRVSPEVREESEKWKESMPGFQGGKREMAAPVTAAIRAAFSPEKRAMFTKAVDFFGGGGNWGIFNALTSFPNIKDLILYERNADRILKIQLFHEKGNLVAEMFKQKNVRDILENAAFKMRQSGVKSGSALAVRIDTTGISDPLLLGLFQAVRDYAENSYAGATDAEGNQTPEQKIATSIRIVGEQAAAAYRAAEAFRQRGGTINYRNADSYKADATPGEDVLSLVDPPYYLTKGYTFTESAPDLVDGSVSESVSETIVGEDTYALTRDLLARLAEAGNAIIYTDSAWWKTSSGKETPYFDLPAAARPLYLPAGREILSDIVDLFDSFGVVAGEIGAGRKEILGIHGHDITTQPGRRTRPQRNARNNEGQGSPDGRNDQPGGGRDDSGETVFGMATGTPEEAGALRSEPSDQVDPDFEDGAPSWLSSPSASAKRNEDWTQEEIVALQQRYDEQAQAASRDITGQIKQAFTPINPKNAFAEWSASTQGEDVIYGYRGENGSGSADNNFGSTEGVGLYIAKLKKDAEWFGGARRVAFPQPKRPLVVDEDAGGEVIPMLNEESEVWESILAHKADATDSAWIKAHAAAAKQIGLTEDTWGEKIDQLPRALTDVLLQQGYDAVYVRSGGMEWINILAKPNQRFSRTARTPMGQALYSPSASRSVDALQSLVANPPYSLSKSTDQKQIIDDIINRVAAGRHNGVNRYVLRVLPIDAMTPVQTGEDYLNDSSRETARRIAAGTVLDARWEDALPGLLNKDGTINDGHHRHAAATLNGDATIPVVVPADSALAKQGTALFSPSASNPAAEYRYLKAKQEKAGLTPAENEALLRAETAMGQTFAFPMDQKALAAPRGSVTPRFQPFLPIPRTERASAQQMSLFSPSTSSPSQQAVDAALQNLAPIYREVFQASLATPEPTPAQLAATFRVTKRAIENIIGTVRTRIRANLETATPDGLAPQGNTGRPDLGYSTVPSLQRVDQIRTEEGQPLQQTTDEIRSQADQLLQRPNAVRSLIDTEEEWTAVQTAAANIALVNASLKGETSLEVAELAAAYREQGSRWSETGRARQDIHRSPAERHAMLISELLASPDETAASGIKKAKTKQDRNSILQSWMARVKGIKEAMLNRGIDIDDAFQRLNQQINDAKAAESEASATHRQLVDSLTQRVQDLETSLQQAKSRAQSAATAAQKAIADAEAARAQQALTEAQQAAQQATELDPANTIRLELSRLSKRHRAVVEAMRDGATWDQAAAQTGLTVEEARKVMLGFIGALRKAAIQTLMLAEDMLLGREQTLASPATLPSGAAESRAQRLGRIADALIGAMGYSMDRFDRVSKPAANKKPGKAKKEATPGPPMMSDEEFTRRQNNPDTHRALWQWEMTATQPQSRISFEEWMARPATKARIERQARMWALPVSTTTGERSTNPVDRDRLLPTRPDLVSTTTGALDMHDPASVLAAARELAATRASKTNKVLEFWRMSILTGFQTSVVNFASNAANSIYNLGPRRIIEAGVNDVLGIIGQGDPNSATLGELAVMARQSHKALRLAGQNMLKSWATESRIAESQFSQTLQQMELGSLKGEEIMPALGGKLGLLMRSLSYRHMTAADELFKGFHGHLEAAAQAHRIAKREKLTGSAYEARIAELMEYGSEAWMRALAVSENVTFQTRLNPKDPRALAVLDKIGAGIKGYTNKYRALTFFFPFITTPANIFKSAIEMSPVGALLAVIDGTRALKIKLAKGNMTKQQADLAASELYDRARLIKDVTNQLIATGIFWALSGMVEPEDDEDLPRITGSTDWRSTSKGQRDTEMRVMPPMSIRIGKDNFVSYSRIDPFATVFASIADAIHEVSITGMNEKALGNYFMKIQNQLDDKTFLSGVSDLVNAIKDPERFASKLTGSIVTGFVPNLIRQPIREADPYVRDTKPREEDGFWTALGKQLGYSLAPGYAAPLMDVWGNPITRHQGQQIGSPATDIMLRVFDPSNIAIGKEIDPIDLYVFNWNRQTQDPKQKLSLEPISNHVLIGTGADKTKIPLTPEEQAEANRNAGKAARAFLGNQWNPQAPTLEGIERIKDTVQRFQRFERDKLRTKKIREAR